MAMEAKHVVDSLIREVKTRPILWDKKHELHKNRAVIDRVWDEVAAVIGKNKDQIKMKWRNLRDQFSREVKKNPIGDDGIPIIDKYNGKWAYYELLTFLKDNVYWNPSDDNRLEDSQDGYVNDFNGERESDISIIIKRDPDLDEDIERDIEGDRFLDPLLALEVQEDTSDSNLVTTETNEVPRKRLCQRRIRTYYPRQLQSEGSHAARSPREVDDDLHFALSLVPYLRSLDPLRKLIIRNEMQNLLIGELMDTPKSNK
ncbi:transcription factor Adf-1-like [Cydia splendana]|uniref:transcription factor Adf-1-like n=1 Tax=Cydia splendana TaxID=1100963 RepID=UPI00300C9312